MKLSRIPDALAERIVARQKQSEQCLVRDGYEAEKRLWRNDMIKLLVSLVVLFAAELLPTGPYKLLDWAVLGAIVGSSGLISLRRGNAYRNGWLDGRHELVAAMKARGVTDGVRNAYEHDLAHVMGFVPDIPDTLEGLE